MTDTRSSAVEDLSFAAPLFGPHGKDLANMATFISISIALAFLAVCGYYVFPAHVTLDYALWFWFLTTAATALLCFCATELVVSHQGDAILVRRRNLLTRRRRDFRLVTISEVSGLILDFWVEAQSLTPVYQLHAETTSGTVLLFSGSESTAEAVARSINPSMELLRRSKK